MVYEEAGKFNQAAYYYQQARQMAPTEPDVVANLARALLRSGQTVDQVRTVLDDVIALDPRPEWRRWAAEKLGVNPAAEPTGDTESTTSGAETPSSAPLPVPGNPFLDDAAEEIGPHLTPATNIELRSHDRVGEHDWLRQSFELDHNWPDDIGSVLISDQPSSTQQLDPSVFQSQRR